MGAGHVILGSKTESQAQLGQAHNSALDRWSGSVAPTPGLTSRSIQE